MASGASSERVRVWDLPTRLVHWALAVLVVVAWLTGGERMDIHRYAGYGILGLVVFVGIAANVTSPPAPPVLIKRVSPST